METIHSTPLPKKKKVSKMTFYEALSQIMAGKIISRVEWDNDNEYALMDGEYLSVHRADGKTYGWLVSKADMIAEDWFVLELKPVRSGIVN